ncbi:MAG: sulfotransferase domain-containing protein, partial [Nanoarchaeota archaeon]|nr:sulfotransferase domain-containing protein [Nanoarchaeota archaeon]
MFNYETKRPLLKIKYEELCNSPRQEITKICNFLNVPLEDTLLHHEKVKHDEVNEKGITVGEV